MNEYLNILGVKFNFIDEEMYKIFLNHLIDKMYNK